VANCAKSQAHKGGRGPTVWWPEEYFFRNFSWTYLVNQFRIKNCIILSESVLTPRMHPGTRFRVSFNPDIAREIIQHYFKLHREWLSALPLKPWTQIYEGLGVKPPHKARVWLDTAKNAGAENVGVENSRVKKASKTGKRRSGKRGTRMYAFVLMCIKS